VTKESADSLDWNNGNHAGHSRMLPATDLPVNTSWARHAFLCSSSAQINIISSDDW